MVRSDRRMPNKMRPVKIEKGYMKHAEGSCLIEVGNTKVICTATVEEGTPNFLNGTQQGWITAEYGMIPRSTGRRMIREAARGKVGGRTHEIQRLIGRSLRSVVDLLGLGERTIWIDCDVIQADGGTRTASITGAFVALVDALFWMKRQGMIKKIPLRGFVAATSVGIVDGENVLDLSYEEDSNAEVDMNVVMTSDGGFVEVQGTAEGVPFTKKQMDEIVDLAKKGIQELIDLQTKTVGDLKDIVEER